MLFTELHRTHRIHTLVEIVVLSNEFLHKHGIRSHLSANSVQEYHFQKNLANRLFVKMCICIITNDVKNSTLVLLLKALNAESSKPALQ